MLAYKLQTQISKQLQRRSETIKNSLKKYNKQALLMNPPQATLEWRDVLEYAFLAEFDLLRFSQEDIRDKQWAKPGVREATVKYFQVKCAYSEING